MREYDVVGVEPIGPARLAVRFVDGVTGEVVFRDSFFHGVFEVLKDPATFSRVRCDNGFVEWPGALDLAPDAMHDAIKADGRWVLE
jgi:hypothetical protein